VSGLGGRIYRQHHPVPAALKNDQVDAHYTYNTIDRLNRHSRQNIIICVLEPALWLPLCRLTAHNPTNIVASNAFNKHAKIAGKLQIVPFSTSLIYISNQEEESKMLRQATHLWLLQTTVAGLPMG
jgi:hypothetical protein